MEMKYFLGWAMFSAALYSSTLCAAPSSERPVLRRDDHPVPEEFKYFHEPNGNDSLNHYDARYFRGVISDEERMDSLIHMVRAYLIFFRNKGLETWIAHGTLLGWWWNGKVNCVSQTFSRE